MGHSAELGTPKRQPEVLIEAVYTLFSEKHSNLFQWVCGAQNQKALIETTYP
jgi:hypothetical protein